MLKQFEMMFNRFLRLGIKKPDGWFRVWLLFSLVWMLAIGGKDLADWYTAKTLAENAEKIHEACKRSAICVTDYGYQEPPPLLTKQQQLEQDAIGVFVSTGSFIVRYFGPPMAVPAIIVMVMVIGRWVSDGFNGARD